MAVLELVAKCGEATVDKRLYVHMETAFLFANIGRGEPCTTRPPAPESSPGEFRSQEQPSDSSWAV